MVSNEEPVVSAIIICLNGLRFLDEAIASVLHQTYKSWELLLVDDGSNDGSAELARGHAANAPSRIRYLEHERHQNRGMAASRNLGIREARGLYVAFLDADDKWLPEKLDQQVAMLTAEPSAAMIYGRTLAWHSWGSEGERLGTDYVRELGVRPNRVVMPPELLLLALQNGGPLPSNSNALWRREITNAVGAFDESFPAAYSDVPFYVKVLRRYPVLVASQCWDLYRQHEGNSVRRALAAGEWHPDEPNRARAQLLRWVSRYFALVHENRPEVVDLLRGELIAYDHPWLYWFLRRFRLLGRQTSALTKVSLRWESQGLEAIELRVDRVDGPLLSAGGPQGSVATERWVRDGTRFFLQDVTNESSLSETNTLAVATVWIARDECTVQGGHFFAQLDTPELIMAGNAPGSLNLSWASSGVETVEIRVDSPSGRVLACGGVRGQLEYVFDDQSATSFLMQNVSAALPLTPDNTLSRLDVVRGPEGVSLRYAKLSLEVESIHASGVNNRVLMWRMVLDRVQKILPGTQD